MAKTCTCILCDGDCRPLGIRVTVTDKNDLVLDTQDYCTDCTKQHVDDALSSLGLEVGDLDD